GKNGVTYEKLFQHSLSHVIGRSNGHQRPQLFKSPEFNSDLLIEAPVMVSDAYHQFASDRTVYGRLFTLLSILVNSESVTFAKLQNSAQRERSFMLSSSEEGDRFVSSERLREYLTFMRRVKWIIEPQNRIELTSDGRNAARRKFFNRELLQAINEHVLEDPLDFEKLDEIILSLLSDFIPPTPIRIKERAGMMGIPLNLNIATRVALQILPTTGRFMKGASDGIFPSERGGH
ncbi:MAG: hypothetical protein AAFX06_30970, partial [Planctomycetota bacterium]